MSCPYCGTPVPEGAFYCPTCGRSLRPARHIPRRRARRGLLAAVSALLAAALLLCLSGSYAERTPTARQMARTVVTCGDFSLTNTELGYYFWSEYFYDVNTASGASPDPDKPLDRQFYDGGTTWKEYLLNQALANVRCTMSMVFRAKEEGFSLPADYQKSLDDTLAGFSDSARSSGFLDAAGAPDVGAYLRASYGSGATLESFTAYLENSYLAAAYADRLYDEPTFTAKQISDYYDDYADSYRAEGIEKNDEPLRDLRVLLIAPDDPDSAASWNAAEQTARSVWRQWLGGGGTDEALAKLAQEQSDDAATAANGGAMTDVGRDALTGDLLGWVYDGARKAGDSTVLKTDDGWEIVRLTGFSGRTRWQKAAEADLRHDTYADAYTRVTQSYKFLVNYGGLCVYTPEKLSAAAGTAAAGKTGGTSAENAAAK